jgi:hypothetical protein
LTVPDGEACPRCGGVRLIFGTLGRRAVCCCRRCGRVRRYLPRGRKYRRVGLLDLLVQLDGQLLWRDDQGRVCSSGRMTDAQRLGVSDHHALLAVMLPRRPRRYRPPFG